MAAASEYQAKQAGQIVECPQCKQKSQLPEAEKLLMLEIQGPPLPETKICPGCAATMKFLDTDCLHCQDLRRQRGRRALMVATACLVVLIGVIWLEVSHLRVETVPVAARTVAHVAAPLPQPEVKMPKPVKDLKAGKFYLEQARGSDLVMAVGDIMNVSDNVYYRLRVDLDLLDANGTKIGTVNDYSTELAPNQTWHCLVRVNNPKAVSVRFVGIKEN